MKERSAVTEVEITAEGAEMVSSGPAGHSATEATSHGGEEVAELKSEMLTRGTWKSLKFRPYDVTSGVEPLYPARRHPVKEFINYIRSTWISMGFVETNGPIVESAFWNFDSLFSRRTTQSRDMQDTFFISNPKEITLEDVELLGRVRKMHANGLEGGLGRAACKAAAPQDAHDQRIRPQHTAPRQRGRGFTAQALLRGQGLQE